MYVMEDWGWLSVQDVEPIFPRPPRSGTIGFFTRGGITARNVKKDLMRTTVEEN